MKPKSKDELLVEFKGMKNSEERATFIANLGFGDRDFIWEALKFVETQDERWQLLFVCGYASAPEGAVMGAIMEHAQSREELQKLEEYRLSKSRNAVLTDRVECRIQRRGRATT